MRAFSVNGLERARIAPRVKLILIFGVRRQDMRMTNTLLSTTKN